MFDEQERAALECLEQKMTRDRLQELLRPSGAFRDVDEEPSVGEEKIHFAFDRMTHVGQYYDMRKALHFTRICDFFALLLLVQLPDEIRRSVNVVVGPERGAGPLLESVARYLPGSEIRTVILRKIGPGQVELPSYFRCDRDDHVLLVDDIFRFGRTLEACQRALSHALIMAVGVAVNRAPLSWPAERSTITMPIISVITDPLITYSDENCPWCKRGIKFILV